jgi:hypothetical protein
MTLRVTQAGALVRLAANQQLVITQAGALVRINLVQIRVSQAGALVRINLVQIRVSQAGALVRCTPAVAQTAGVLAVCGLREVRLALGATVVALDAAQKLSLSERATSGQLSGNDHTVGVATVSRALDWELEAGGIPLAAWSLMTGRWAEIEGDAPTRTMEMPATAKQDFPYFRVYGKAISDSDRLLYVKLFRVKLRQAPQGLFGEGRFWTTECGGVAIAAEGDPVYELVMADDEYQQEMPD